MSLQIWKWAGRNNKLFIFVNKSIFVPIVSDSSRLFNDYEPFYSVLTTKNTNNNFFISDVLSYLTRNLLPQDENKFTYQSSYHSYLALVCERFVCLHKSDEFIILVHVGGWA